MLPIIFFIILTSFATGDRADFTNYSVFRITPSTSEHLELLKHLESLSRGFSYWQRPSRVEEPADLMVGPGQQATFAELMDASNMKYEPYIKDVQELIDQENPKTRSGTFDWTRYHSLDQIYAWLQFVVREYPQKLSEIEAGSSYEGRPIKGVKLQSDPLVRKPSVFIEGGIHAPEWISPATVTYLLNELLNSSDPAVRNLTNNFDWYIFPMFNPDGYVYSHTVNRLWRKNVSPSLLTRIHNSCKGTDLNRNWDYKWNPSEGASSDPCNYIYAGSRAFSEIETKTMSEYLKSISDQLFAYISFHNYAQLIIFPYGHTKEHLDNYDEEKNMAAKAVEAIEQVHGKKYKYGSVAETTYFTSGTSTDWVKATLKLPIVYTYELRDNGKRGFLLPADQIIPTGQEVLASLVALFNEAAKYGYPKIYK